MAGAADLRALAGGAEAGEELRARLGLPRSFSKVLLDVPCSGRS